MTDQTLDMEYDFESAMGGDVAREEAKSKGGARFRRDEYLDLKGGEEAKAAGNDRAFLRYLTDYVANPELGVQAWITVDVHQVVPTKPKPANLDKEKGWPKAMSAMCRKHKLFAPKFPQGCYICENCTEFNKSDKKNLPKSRTFALAVLREEVIGDGSDEMGGPTKKGRRIGFTDKMVEVVKTDEEGKVMKDADDNVLTEEIPHYVIVRQSWNNYFQALDQMGRTYGTVLDRDFLVIREGERLDTEYTHVAMDPIDTQDPDDESKIVRLDMSDPRFREGLYGDRPSITRHISEQVSDKHFNQWFIPQDDDDDAAAPEGAAKKAPASASKGREGNEDRLAALRDRLKARG